MKKSYYKISLCLLLIIAGAACNKIELLPVSSKTVEGFYKNEAQINQALIGCYASFKNLWIADDYAWALTEGRSDNTWQGDAYNDGDISKFIVNSSNGLLSSAWGNYYSAIYRCNMVLAALNVVTDEAKRKQYEGEAKFMRALCYFDLVRLFGGVPKVVKPLNIDESYEIPRAGVEEIYDLVVSDFSDAAAALPENYPSASLGRATKWAAKGYLGKTYIFRSGYPLKKNEWQQAKQQLQDIINSGKFEFFADYADIYNQTKEGGKQQLFSIQFRMDQGGNIFPTRNAPNDILAADYAAGGVPFGGNSRFLVVSTDLVNSFEAGDKRKEVAIRSSWKNKSGQTVTTQPYCRKYQNGAVQSAGNWEIDWIALGYTDVLMMYAECLNENGYVPGGEAFDILNRVRTRAGLTPKTSADVPDQQRYRLWMEQERRYEFCFENIRWFDLVRTDRAFDVIKTFLGNYNMSANIKSKDMYIYPIPQGVRDVTPGIQQNPGYF